jgi:hypothetical protein
MSVAVVITPRHGGTAEPTYLPVATDDVFSSYWLPAAVRLGLVWMPLFQSGTTVGVEDFPQVRAEFQQMRDYFASLPDGAAMIEHLRERSGWLSGQLERLDAKNIRDLFIG